MTEVGIYETRGPLTFWDGNGDCDVLPPKTRVHLGPWTSKDGGVSYKAGEVASVCDGLRKGWARLAQTGDLRTISFLELLARAAE